MSTVYADHIAALAATHGITLDVRTSTSGRAWPHKHTIRITRVAGPASYAMALHELGHCVDPEATGRKFSRLHKEMRAWQWAKGAALEWTDRMDTRMQDSLRSYLRRAARHRWPVPPAIYTLVEAE